MKITKSRLKQIIKEELQDVNEALEDEPGWDFLKPDSDPAQSFVDQIARHQDAEPRQARPGRDIAADLGYEEEALDPIEQLATGDSSTTSEILQVLQQLFDLVPPEDAQRFADEAQSLAQAVGGDEPPFRAPDPRKTAELRQGTRAQGGYSGKGAWKSREPNK
mgnify:CR=1 FL=1